MKKNSGNCLVLICALLFGSAAFQRCFAQDWNSWHYYADVTVQPQADPTYDAVYADFSRLLSHDLHESGALDENSIRVAPVVGGVAGDPVPMRFVKDPSFDATNNASGTLVFQVAENAQVGGVTYRVFFDTQANGPKSAMNGNADVPDKANMIWNGSFEILSQGYTGSNIYANAGNNMPRGWFGNFHNMGLLANLATSAHTGDHALGFVTPEDHTNVNPRSSPTPPGVRVTSGQSYDFSFWAKGENLTSVYPLYAYVYWYDGNGTYMSRQSITNLPSNKNQFDWTQVSTSMIAPAGAAFTEMVVGTYSKTGVLTIDDFEARKTFAPPLTIPPSDGAPFVLKFDFGKSGSPVFPGFTAVNNSTLMTADSSYGFVGTAPTAYDEIRPNALEGDFVYSKGKSTFRVNLPNGDYKAWFLYGNSRYTQRVLVPLPMNYQIDINGKSAVSDPINGWQDLYSEKYFFRGYSDVYHANDDFYTKFIAPNFKEATATFTVNNGYADFDLVDMPLDAMQIYAADPADAGKVEDDIVYLQSQLRHYTTITEVAHTADNPDPNYSAQDIQTGYVTYSRFPTSPPYANDRPTLEELNSAPSTSMAQNQKKTLAVSILPLRDLENVNVTVSDLLDSATGAKIAGTDVVIQYAALQQISARGSSGSPTPVYSYQVEPIFIKPFPKPFNWMDKGINRTILLTVTATSHTSPGTYEGTLNISPQNAPAKQVPVTVQVLPLSLPPLPIPAGRFAFDSDFYYNLYWSKTITDPSFVDYVWARQQMRMQWAKDMGLTSIALTDDARADILSDPMRLNPDGRFVRWMDLYKSMGFQAMPWYGLQSLTTYAGNGNYGFGGAERFSPEWTSKYRQLIENTRDTGIARNWPEVVIYLSDELSNSGDAGATDGLNRIAASDGITGIRRISSVNGLPEHAFIGKEDILMPNAAFPITQDVLDQMRAANTTLWVYNVGDFRFTWGYYLFRVGAQGRFQWFNCSGMGFPFDDFDSQYGDSVYSAFVAGPNGPVSELYALNMREGLDDYRYLTLLKSVMDKTHDKNSDEYKAAQSVLDEIQALDVDLRDSMTGNLDGQAAGIDPDAKIWSPETCEEFRSKVASATVNLITANSTHPSEWHYRADTWVLPQADDTFTAVHADFSQLLSDLGDSSPLDENSIRVAPVVNGVVGQGVAMKFIEDPNFDVANHAAGTIVFQVEGSETPDQVMYRVFFDTQANGPKSIIPIDPNVPNAANMIWNGSFEILSDGYQGPNRYPNAGAFMPQGWWGNLYNSGLRSNAAYSAHSGSEAFGFITPDNSQNVNIRSTPTPLATRVVSGQSYDFSFWIKGDDLTSVYPLYAYIYWYDDDGRYMTRQTLSGLPPNKNQFDWTQVSASVNVPNGAAFTEMVVGTYSHTGLLTIDDFEVRPTTPSSLQSATDN